MYRYTPGAMVFFQELLIWFNLSMTFVMIIAVFWVKFVYFYKKNILPKMSHLTPWGAYVLTYPLGQWHLC